MKLKKDFFTYKCLSPYESMDVPAVIITMIPGKPAWNTLLYFKYYQEDNQQINSQHKKMINQT